MPAESLSCSSLQGDPCRRGAPGAPRVEIAARWEVKRPRAPMRILFGRGRVKQRV